MNTTPQDIGNIAVMFLSIRNSVKIYHWQTPKYSRHKASDKLVFGLTDKIDKFIEVFQGSRGTRLVVSNDNNFSMENQTDSSIINLLNAFKSYLSNTLPLYLLKTDTDLFNIRDEMLADINQALYLFTFT